MPRSTLDIAGTLAALSWATLAVASWRREEVPVLAVLVILAVAWSATAMAVVTASRSRAAHLARRILIWGALFRVIGLMADPVLDDDWARFLWDGFQCATTGDPYAPPPQAAFSDPRVPPRFAALLSQVNNPDVPTLYAPLTQGVFLLAHAMAPGALWSLKLLLVLTDLALLALLAGRISAAGLALAAWAPLAVHETAFNAHPDVVGVMLVIAAFAVVERRAHLAGLLLGAAIAAKGFAVLFVALLIRRSWQVIPGLLLGLALPYAWFVLHGGTAGIDGTAAFLTGWEFNSFGYALIARLADRGAAHLILLLATLAATWWACCRPRHELPRGDVIVATFFCFAPVVNPWYLLWLLPFAAMWPRPWSVAMLAAVSLSYLHGSHWARATLVPYAHPAWVRPLEVATVAAAVIAARRWGLFRT